MATSLRQALALPLYALALVLDVTSPALGRLAGDDWPYGQERETTGGGGGLREESVTDLPIVRSVTAASGGRALFCERVCSNQKISKSYEQKSSRREHLTVTTKDGKIELTEEELKKGLLVEV